VAKKIGDLKQDLQIANVSETAGLLFIRVIFTGLGMSGVSFILIGTIHLRRAELV